MNPHAGEGGLLGAEDRDILAPAVAHARECGADVTGPLPADTVFRQAVDGRFDAVVACYHDQGLIPVKLVAFGKAVNVTLGLPIIRTSVDHGTALDIAGRGVADSSSLVHAVLLAAQLARHGDFYGHVEVAVPPPADVGHALASQPEACVRLGALRDLDGGRLPQGGHFDFSPERQRWVGDRQIAQQVVTVAVEERVVMDVNDHVQVAGRTTSTTVLALPGETKPLGRRNAGWNFHRKFAFATLASLSVTGLTGLPDDTADATAMRAGPGNGEKSLLEPDLSASLALAATFRATPWG